MGDTARYILKTAKGSVGLKPQVTMARKRDQRGEDGYEGYHRYPVSQGVEIQKVEVKF